MNTVGDVISKYRKKEKLTQPMLSEKLAEHGINVSYKTISGWEKGISEPSIRAFIETCHLLGIPDIYEALYGNNPFKTKEEPENNTSFLSLISALNNDGMEKLTEYAELLISSCKYEKSAPKITSIIPRRLKFFDIPVSAGTGNFLTGDSFTWKEVGDDVPRGADYGVRITGDSMEPRFHDGQPVWVHHQETLNSGDIGIFCLNGDAYCKKLQDDKDGVFLISLNDKYSPIPVGENDELTVLGRVL